MTILDSSSTRQLIIVSRKGTPFAHGPKGNPGEWFSRKITARQNKIRTLVLERLIPLQNGIVHLKSRK